MEKLDLAFYIYVFCFIISVWGFSLFTWWWRKIGTATDVYIFVSLWFLTNGFSDAVAAYSRYLRLACPEDFSNFGSSFLWILRRLPEMFVLIFFICRMTKRVIRAKEKLKNGEAIIVHIDKKK